MKSNTDSQLLLDYAEDQRLYDERADEAKIVRSSKVIWACFMLFTLLGIWAYYAMLVEVSTGLGKVIPSSREQVIQSLEGGIIAELFVREGSIVEANQVLAQLDLTKTQATVGESSVQYRAARARIARLEAEVSQTALEFPVELNDFPDLKTSEVRLYETRRRGLQESISGLQDSLNLLQQELKITSELAEIGAASNVDVIKLRRQLAEVKLKISERHSDYMVSAREDLTKAKAEAESLEEIIKGREDSLLRLTLRSPVKGVVKDIAVTTRGGVIPPNGQLMAIVPMDEQLVVEARISPRDIAFIHPGQEAKVKITAYDHSIYGALDGIVMSISPDTIQDEVKPEIYYYRVFIQTDDDALSNALGTRFPIVPGMIATVDIRTGEKTVFDYLMKPINQAKEALRER